MTNDSDRPVSVDPKGVGIPVCPLSDSLLYDTFAKPNDIIEILAISFL